MLADTTLWASKSVSLKKRRANSYGNTSVRTVPLEQRVYLPEVEVVNPPITWEQFLVIQQRVKKNQELAQRNAKRDYLLRGFICCGKHEGKKGEPRIYFGHPANGTYYYQCPVGGCKHPNLNGPEIEDAVKRDTRRLLNLRPEEFYKQIGDQGNIERTRESLEKELGSLEAKYNRNINAETDLERRDLMGQVHPEVYRRIKSQLQAERIWVEERKQAITDQLAQLGREAEAVESLQQIKTKFADRLDTMTNQEWRDLLTTLNFGIWVSDNDDPTTSLYYGLTPAGQKLIDEYGIDTRDEIKMTWGLPLAEQVASIVFKGACPSPSS